MFVPAAPEPSPFSSALNIVDKSTKVAAVIIGATWGYVNYVRGRTFKKRLELKITATKLKGEIGLLLSGNAQMKNVGLSKFPIEQKGTAIVFYDLKKSGTIGRLTEPTEDSIGVLEVFKDHAWIEPGETVAEDFIVELGRNDERIALKIDLRVVAAHIEWNTNCIVEVFDDKRPDDSEEKQDQGAHK
jgi:hypothetical protein